MSKPDREILGRAILEHIRQRTEGGTGVRRQGRGFSLYSFPSYSESYTESLDFKVAGKSKNDIDLTLSGDMLASMDVLRDTPRSITIGFKNNTEENSRAEGNQLGSYGRSPNPKKARRFLGLTASELETLLESVRSD